MSMDLTTLNENQLEAVHWNEGPLLVLAGPGSGKTRVLTYRIARLLDDSAGERFRILGVTFTNKAAAEMRTRLEALLKGGKERALLTTFHSFAAEILRQHGHHIGLRPDFTILVEQADREAVATEAMSTLSEELADTISGAANALPVIDKMLAECSNSNELAERLASHRHKEFLTQLFNAYRAQLIQGNHLDFASLIGMAVELLEERPAIARQFQRVYRFVCVDEFQDTNETQFRLLCSLIPAEKPNLFVVADDDQLIYQWNGANPKRLQDLRERFAMETVQLPENYRCPPAVIELANNLIGHNLDRSADKERLKAHKVSTIDSHLRVFNFGDFSQEVAWVVSELKQTAPEDRNHCVVLGRSKKLLDAVVAECVQQGVPAYIAVRKSQFISAPVSWLHAALRLANARQDREQLRKVCKAFYSLEGNNIRVEDVVAGSSFQSGDYFRSWLEAVLGQESVSALTRVFLEQAKATLLERTDHWAFIDAAFKWFEALRNHPTAIDNAFDEYEEEKEVWGILQQEIIQQYGRSEVSLHSLLQEFDLRSKETPPPKDAVRCLTIHSSKGLEFKRVYLIGLVEDQLPSWAATKKGDDSFEMREERRNCFVAITRAEEALTITYSGRYFGYSKAPSRFLAEMGIVKEF
jgi:DNA helicase-2/ATP-dependent DNA helicase PcrA